MTAPLEKDTTGHMGGPDTAVSPRRSARQSPHMLLHLSSYRSSTNRNERQKLRSVLIAPDLSEPARPNRGSTRLRRILVELDALALILAWLPLLLESSSANGTSGQSTETHKIIAAGLTTVISLFLAAAWRLYQARVCKVKNIERALLFRLAVVSTIVSGVVLTQLDSRANIAAVVVARDAYTYRCHGICARTFTARLCHRSHPRSDTLSSFA